MGFYEALSRYYDDVFPFKKTTYDFLNDRFADKGQILDIATGTGNYALALAKDDYKVTAIDLDKKMIEALKTKANNTNLELAPKVMNMLDLSTLESNSYDSVFCIGNSLVHLQTLEEIQQAVHEIYSLLKDDGQVIIQIVNYDRILKKEVRDLPLIDRPDVPLTFIRKYQLIDQMIHFKTRLIVNKDEVYDHVITLYPLTSTQLHKLLSNAGFKDIQLYGGFNESPFTIESFPLIVTAVK